MFLYKVIFGMVCVGLCGCIYGAHYFADTILNFLIVGGIASELLCLLYGMMDKIFLKYGKRIFLLILLITIFAILLPKCYYGIHCCH